jgi:hypothetical protein
MRVLLLTILLFVAVSFYSCSLYFDAFLRNMTRETATIDVFLNKRNQWATLPNRVKTACKLVNFKSGYKKYFSETTYVTWFDSVHFQLKVSPNSTIDLSQIAGTFLNSSPTKDVRVIVSTGSKVDTLINGHSDFRHDLFKYKSKAFRPILYYDVK